ncbi:MAG: hypothetical protein KBT06_08605 [Prevotellaceae bacterium]|nr:hypothetical protein [Candidatus Colivivens equi]
MKLIDCNETLRKVEQIPFIANENKAFHEGCRYMQKKVLRIFHESKSVDAEPVRHGHWIDGFDTDGILIDYDCSVCNMANDETSNYCPNCGAKML